MRKLATLTLLLGATLGFYRYQSEQQPKVKAEVVKPAKPKNTAPKSMVVGGYTYAYLTSEYDQETGQWYATYHLVSSQQVETLPETVRYNYE